MCAFKRPIRLIFLVVCSASIAKFQVSSYCLFLTLYLDASIRAFYLLAMSPIGNPVFLVFALTLIFIWSLIYPLFPWFLVYPLLIYFPVFTNVYYFEFLSFV